MKKIILLLLFPILSFSQKPVQTRQSVDLIVHNAIVYTVDNDFKTAQAFAVKDGLFVEIGKSVDILKKYKSTKTIDAKGKPIYPGFYDPHSHFFNYAQTLWQANLVGTKSFEEIIQRLKLFDSQHTDSKWVMGRGWDQNDWTVKQFPSKELLDKVFPKKPVALVRVDGHAMIVNSEALKIANITASSKVEGGLVELKNGEPTGILVDNAMRLARQVFPKPTKAELTKMLLAAQKDCFKLGLTTISDAGINRSEIELLDELHKANQLKIREYAMVRMTDENLDYYLKKGIYKTDRLNVRSFKIVGDGALGSRGACLLEPYSDDPNHGFLLSSFAVFDQNISRIYNSDFQANTHCIGDSTNRLILDIYGKNLKGKNDRRWRIEHAQIVTKEDLPKFGKYSIIPSIQTTHATSDMYWAGNRLGTERLKTAYAFKDLLEQNGLLANGSDFPVEALNPLYGFHSAVARQDAKNFPAGGFQMENALTREQALKAMTIWAAYANFEEKERGSIEPGKMADFVLLEADLMKIDQKKLRNVKVLNTFVGGEKVF
jgi:predicted amidohydrolase YtcJ